MLPRIKIQYLNGQLGTVGESTDSLFGLVCGATAVKDTFAHEKPYTLHSVDELAGLGVTKENNSRLYKHVEDFYNEAEEGTKVIVFGVDKAKKLTELCDKQTGSVKDLITAENGNLRGIFLALDAPGESDSENGIDEDVITALPKAQQLAEWATTELYAPLFIILEGHGYSGENMPDLTENTYNRVGVLLGDTEAESVGACIGVFAGALSQLSVQRNVGRVKNGALFPLKMYIGSKLVDESQFAIADLYDKGYIVPRKYVGRSGYFYADDPLACAMTDDYAHLTARRTIDKVYRITYNTLLDLMLDELEVNEDGTLQSGIVKSWEQTVENAINRQMTVNGELSANEDGEGCSCYIDPTQNVLSTSKLNVVVKARPYGYARYVDVALGFLVTKTS